MSRTSAPDLDRVLETARRAVEAASAAIVRHDRGSFEVETKHSGCAVAGNGVLHGVALEALSRAGTIRGAEGVRPPEAPR